MNLAEQHENAVKIRVGTRHSVVIAFSDGSKRTVLPVVNKGPHYDDYPNLVRVRTIPREEGADRGGVEMQSQAIGEVINLPPVDELCENEIVFVSGLVMATLAARGEFGYSGRVVSPGKTQRDENGSVQAILSWTTIRSR